MSELVNYSLEEGTAEISIDDGKVNVMSIEMLKALDAALTCAEGEAKMLVLRSGIEGMFSAGFDLKIFAANDAQQSLEMVRRGAELALRLMGLPMPTVGVMQGHAYPMGTFLLLACDVRLGQQGPYRMGLNEVAIRITPPAFAVELARSRLHPAFLSRTVVLGEMFEPDEALVAGFLDKVVAADQIEQEIAGLRDLLGTIHQPSHKTAKQRLRGEAMKAIRHAIDTDLKPDAYQNRGASAVKLPGGR